MDWEERMDKEDREFSRLMLLFVVLIAVALVAAITDMALKHYWISRAFEVAPDAADKIIRALEAM